MRLAAASAAAVADGDDDSDGDGDDGDGDGDDSDGDDDYVKERGGMLGERRAQYTCRAAPLLSMNIQWTNRLWLCTLNTASPSCHCLSPHPPHLPQRGPGLPYFQQCTPQHCSRTYSGPQLIK